MNKRRSPGADSEMNKRRRNNGTDSRRRSSGRKKQWHRFSPNPATQAPILTKPRRFELQAMDRIGSDVSAHRTPIFSTKILSDMDLAFVPPMYPPKGNRAIYEVKPFSSALHRNLDSQRTSPRLATAAKQTSQASGFVVENKNHDLLRAIQKTKRGLVAAADQRSSIEEALVWFYSSIFVCFMLVLIYSIFYMGCSLD
ncbi:hypothetical protein SO802_007939 [Lithocarpus litseifolius]|uniref:Uncharacterized protein n=1 Tax=Lithocarpus litseifolius TaxID=425828 RepID=A0AAW2DVS2_9ROSI